MARKLDKLVKRILDTAIAALGLLLLLPLLVILAGLVWIFLRRPVLFRQHRPGLHGRPFLLCKFRTMNQKKSADGKLLPDSDRVTPFGRFLRSSSLDELPQLWNVLLGQMSLVGPRPLLMEYLDRYSPDQARRQDVVPGITGWSQVNGRNALDWDEKLALDIWYVDHCSLALDMKILWATARKVLLREGITRKDHASMPEFIGAASDSSPKK